MQSKQNQTTTTISLPKPSRTLIIPDFNNEAEFLLNENKNLYSNVFKTNKEKVSCFIECNSIQDSIIFYNLLSEKNLTCRYANYRMFIRITSDTSVFNYDKFKTIIKKKLRDIVDDINVMYFKLYQKDNRLTGNGYIVIDKYDDLKKVIKNNFACEETGVTFQLLNFINKN